MVTINTLYRMLDEIMLDDNFWAPRALVDENVVLALIQVDLDARFRQLCQILDMRIPDVKAMFKKIGRFANYEQSIKEG